MSVSEGWLGWAAGVIDGEGCITFSRQKRGPQKQWVHDQLWLKVTSTDPRLCLKMQELFGGRINPARMAARSTRPFWEWYVTRTGCAQILVAVLPYLIVKREQAEVALEFVATPKRNVDGKFMPVSAEENVRREDIRGRLKLLKGPRTFAVEA